MSILDTQAGMQDSLLSIRLNIPYLDLYFQDLTKEQSGIALNASINASFAQCIESNSYLYINNKDPVIGLEGILEDDRFRETIEEIMSIALDDLLEIDYRDGVLTRPDISLPNYELLETLSNNKALYYDRLLDDIIKVISDSIFSYTKSTFEDNQIDLLSSIMKLKGRIEIKYYSYDSLTGNLKLLVLA